MQKWSVFIFILMPGLISPTKDSSVYDYGPTNFVERIEELDGNFIMFYTSWCQHCIPFHRIWEDLGKLVNTKESKFAIAKVDCTLHFKICREYDVAGYPTLLYFHKNSFTPVEYKGTRDLPSLTLFLSEVFIRKVEKIDDTKESNEVKIYSGMAYLNDQNVEKFISTGQHFIMFYSPWCKASQELAPTWAELAIQYAHNEYIQFGKVNCAESEMTCKNFNSLLLSPLLLWIVNGRTIVNADAATYDDLKAFVEKMVLAENHDPDKFMKKKKILPVARICEETYETFFEKELVFINYFAPWCAHCMQMGPLWIKLGEKFLNESRVLIADVDCVRSKRICDSEKIIGLPTLILYRNKQIITVEYGGQPLDHLISLVNQHLGENKTTSEEKMTSDENTKNRSEEGKTKDEL